MKKIFVLHTLINLLFTLSLWSQKIQTDTLKVFGNCGMCKSRIERASFIKGVISSKWSSESQLLIIQYKPNKVSLKAIEQALLNVGHDLENQKAPDEIYEKLHSCCKYREKK